MLQAMRCSNGSRKLFSLRHLLGRGFLFWRGRKFLFRFSLNVSLLGKQLVELSMEFFWDFRWQWQAIVEPRSAL